MSRTLSSALAVLMVAVAAACQPQAPGVAVAPVGKKAAISKATASASPVGGGAVVQPGQPTPAHQNERDH